MKKSVLNPFYFRIDNSIFLTIGLLLFALTMHAQQMYLKEVLHLYGSHTETYIYNYDNAWNLDSITCKYDEDRYYSNDTLFTTRLSSVTGAYDYFNDSVLVERSKNGNQSPWFKYFVDEADQVTEMKNYQTTYHCLNTWSDNNLIEVESLSNGFLTTYEYYEGILNPHYNENKYLKGTDNPIGYWSGSQNMIKLIEGQNDKVEYKVYDTLNGYPAVATIIEDDNLFVGTVYYDYYVITGIPELPVEPARLISVSFFNILGQEIDKPRRGFYIERKITNKGIISTKYYIP